LTLGTTESEPASVLECKFASLLSIGWWNSRCNRSQELRRVISFFDSGVIHDLFVSPLTVHRQCG
jgi:hypothetical protein